jgi:hypothetical protein
MIHDDRRLVCPLSDSPDAEASFASSSISRRGDLSKPQTWSNIPLKQAFFMSTPTHRE